MTIPFDESWDGTVTVSPDRLNKTTYGQGTSFPATWPTTRLFWRTDENILYKNTGTEGTPVFTALGLVESTEQTLTTAAHDASTTLSTNSLIISPIITLPTTYKFIKLTAVTVRIGGATSGNLKVGVGIVDVDPPVNTGLLILAKSQSTAVGSINTDQKVTLDEEGIIVGKGNKIVIMVMFDNATAQIRYITGASNNVSKALGSFNYPSVDTTAWGVSTANLYGSVHFVGYN